MLARQIRRPRPGLVLLQHPDDLIFREPCSLHLSVLQEGRTLNPRGGKSQWQVTSAAGGPKGWILEECLDARIVDSPVRPRSRRFRDLPAWESAGDSPATRCSS